MRQGSHSARLRVAGLLAALACAATAFAAPAGTSAATRLHPAMAVSGEVARVESYWTPARMRSTPPLDAPAPLADSARISFAPVAEPTVPPFVVNGRLFVVQGRSRGYCSATAIDSPTRRLVLTAGHCVNSGPRDRRGDTSWSHYLEFVPGYSEGIAPFGAFVAYRNSVFAPRQWVKTANPNFDFGALMTAPNAEGVNVADAVGGGAKIATDLPRRQQYQTFGYPGSSHTMQGCESPYVGDDNSTYGIPGLPTIAIRCRWAPGASGGGWLIENGTEINGLTSYGKRRDSVHTFGPYFSQTNVGRLVAGL
jgi:V8-like Glu-specific endopeptidase